MCVGLLQSIHHVEHTLITLDFTVIMVFRCMYIVKFLWILLLKSGEEKVHKREEIVHLSFCIFGDKVTLWKIYETLEFLWSTNDMFFYIFSSNFSLVLIFIAVTFGRTYFIIFFMCAPYVSEAGERSLEQNKTKTKIVKKKQKKVRSKCV